MTKPITLYSHASGPNPWKVAIVLEELGIPYHTKMMEFSELKKEPFEKININGRVPAIEDPNTGITLWESGAILEYLVDEYDKEGKLSFKSSPEKYEASQWVYFQASGQGPYFGQAAWFSHFHEEKVPSAVTRYNNEIKRVVRVLDRALEGKEYLVGGRVSFADLAFLTWQMILPFAMGDAMFDAAKEYPNYHAWNERLMARPAVKKVVEDKQKATGK
ncbi:MAG: glutathione S- transferase, nitrogen catabolite repression regulator [Sclerophora amabilis]|nr:MAG: glutathione S- transferase, nitrogen catabolite repression regulator [Sclerophora amabilis]